MISQLFSHTGTLILFILRRDRVRIPIWFLSITSVTLLVAVAFSNLYASDQERQVMAETMKNPAMIAMIGKGYGLEDYTIGIMLAHQMLLFTAITIGLMSILLMARHTRADEEDGRMELIRSLPVGRLSHLGASFIVVSLIYVLLAIMIGCSLSFLKIESIDFEGSLLYGMVLGGIGIFFAAVTAVFAQLSGNARGTIGLSVAFLLLSYLVRAIGDVSYEAVSWFSPLGWILKTEVYFHNFWGPLIIILVTTLLLITLAFYLNASRDLESSFLPSRPGKKHASVFLQSPMGLAFRLQRTGFIAWAIGIYLLGASYGSVFGDLESFFQDNEMLQQMLVQEEGLSLMEQFIPMLMSVMAMICTIPALMAILKLKGEERYRRIEPILSRSVSRPKLIGSYLIISLVVGFLSLSLAAIGLWSAGNAVMEDGLDFVMIYQSAMVYLPAIWLMTSLAVLLIGLMPKYTGFSWLYLGYSFFVVYLGGLMDFPDWMGTLSPFGHIPPFPVEEVNIWQWTLLLLAAIGIGLIGFISYQRRDMTG